MGNEHSTHISRNRQVVPATGLTQTASLRPNIRSGERVVNLLRFSARLPQRLVVASLRSVRATVRGLSALRTKKAALAPAGESAHQTDGAHIQGINGLFLIMERARTGAERSAQLFPVVTAAIFCLSSLCIAFLILVGGHLLLSACSPLFLGLTAIIPSILLAAALAHLIGNYLLRRFSGLNNLERRSLALHLPWNRTPAEWPAYFRRWIYCGDWLVEDFSGDLLPYVRAFVTGDVPQNIEEELALWSGFMQSSRRSQEIEVGHSVRELACVDALPSWTREITPGMNLPELEKALGKTGHDWAVSLLKRAATRKRIFTLVDITGDLHEAIFEFHYSRLSSKREGLMVIIRPHLQRDVKFMEDSFSDVA